MSLTKDTTAESLMSSVTVVPGTPQNSSAMTIDYGCSLVTTITNGGTGPTIAASATLQVSADNSTWYSTDDVRSAGVTASAVYTFVFNQGVGGVNSGDWTYSRVQIGSNTAQNVTGNVVGSHTTGL